MSILADIYGSIRAGLCGEQAMMIAPSIASFHAEMRAIRTNKLLSTRGSLMPGLPHDYFKSHFILVMGYQK